MEEIDPRIREYVEKLIIPRYAAFDKAHRIDHVEMVIRRSLQLAEHEPGIDIGMVYLSAAFHDLGLVAGRENHHIESRHILESDEFVRSNFNRIQIRAMGEAVEDHRASKGSRPRNIYGLIIAEADRYIDPETIIRRTVQYGLDHYPHLDRDGHYERTRAHLEEKYGPAGYLKIWIPWSDNAARLDALRQIIADSEALRPIFDRIFDEETRDDLTLAIRKGIPCDIDAIMACYASAKDYMRRSGNPNQWVGGYPSRQLVEEDIAAGVNYVGVDRDGVIAMTFVFMTGDDPTYAVIEDGEWPDSRPYGTIHRIGSTGKYSGMLRQCVEFCSGLIDTLRLDTHADNLTMQRAAEKLGFHRCGIIYCADGTPRIAYQRNVP